MGKKKRLQPRPKKKKVVFVSKQDKLNLMKKDLTLKIKYDSTLKSGLNLN